MSVFIRFRELNILCAVHFPNASNLYSTENLRPVLPDAADDGNNTNNNAGIVAGLSRLIESCWGPDPAARPGFAAVEASLDTLAAEYRAMHEMAPDQPLEPVWWGWKQLLIQASKV